MTVWPISFCVPAERQHRAAAVQLLTLKPGSASLGDD
jgi:hypothetical protein